MPHDICVLYMFSLRLWKLIYPSSTSISDSPSNCWTPVTCWLLAAEPFSLENSFFNNDRLRPLRKTLMSIWKCQKKNKKSNSAQWFLKKQHLLKVIIVPIDFCNKLCQAVLLDSYWISRPKYKHWNRRLKYWKPNWRFLRKCCFCYMLKKTACDKNFETNIQSKTASK